MAQDRAVWVYAVAGRIESDWLDAVAGVDGAPVRAAAAAGLAAAITSVSLEEFGEEPLRSHLEDLSWLDATARAHHRVIEIIARHGALIPMRLATIFHDDSSVADMLTQRRDGFDAVLHQVAGQAEWGVKIYAAGQQSDPAGSAAGRAGQAQPAGGTASPGAEYLRRRREALSATQDNRRAVQASADAVHAALGSLATSAQLRPPQAPQLSGQAARMVLNAAYLVHQDRSQDFTAAAGRIAGQHPAVRLELTGPWPPYSFATVDLVETAGGRTSA